jgi:hypothetical protein
MVPGGPGLTAAAQAGTNRAPTEAIIRAADSVTPPGSEPTSPVPRPTDTTHAYQVATAVQPHLPGGS